MIVDCHTHLTTASSEVSEEHLEAVATVDQCFVLPKPSGEKDTNAVLSEYVAKNSEKMIGFACIDPTAQLITEKFVNSVTKKLGLKGIVLYCADCGFHPAHSSAMQLYEIAEKLTIPIYFHNNGDVGSEGVLAYAQPYLLDEIARVFPKLSMIVGSMGVPFFEQTLVLIAKHENVYADLTILPGNVWQVYNIIMRAHEQKMLDKLLFGSGYPKSTPGQCIEAILGFNKLLGDTNLPTVPRGDLRAILERNTLQILGIS